MNRRSFLKIGAAGIAMALVPSLMPSTTLLQADGGSTVQAPAAGAGGQLLPRSVIIPLATVSNQFSGIVQEASTGPDQTVVGNAMATRAVIYASSDGVRKVTLSVDQYPNGGDASSAYQEAVRGSQIPGLKLLDSPNLGDQAYAGTVTMGAETHVGVGVLRGALVVGATTAGFDATPETIDKLFTLAGSELDFARAALGGS